MRDGTGIAYTGKYYSLFYEPLHSFIDGKCNGVKLRIYNNDEYHFTLYWSREVKFKNLLFEKTIPFEERLKRTITEGSEEVMRRDEIDIKENECDVKCRSKIDKSIKGVLND